MLPEAQSPIATANVHDAVLKDQEEDLVKLAEGHGRQSSVVTGNRQNVMAGGVHLSRITGRRSGQMVDKKNGQITSQVRTLNTQTKYTLHLG